MPAANRPTTKAPISQSPRVIGASGARLVTSRRSRLIYMGFEGSVNGLISFLRHPFTIFRRSPQTPRIQSLRLFWGAHLLPFVSELLSAPAHAQKLGVSSGSSLGPGPTDQCLDGGRRGHGLDLSVNDPSIGRGREMAGLGATIAGIALALSIASPVAAKAKRAVVLLDFSRPTPPPAISDPVLETSEEVSPVSRAMASQFTGAPMDPAYSAPGVELPTAGMGLRSLGNPFLAYSVATRPITPLFDMTTTDTCAAPAYRPSFGFGRAAEDRRRTIFPLVHQAACEFGLPVGLFDALIMQESRYQPAAVSPKGAFGLAQLMPGTARQLRVDPYSLRDNIRGGARYLKQQVDRFGRYDLALAAYNAGPGRVERRRQVPQIAETQAYVRTIMSNWTGIAPQVKSAPRLASYRQAQMIFMPHQAARF